MDTEERNLQLLRFVHSLMAVFYGFAWALLAEAVMKATQARAYFVGLFGSDQLVGLAKYGFVFVSAVAIAFVSVALSSWLWRLRRLSLGQPILDFFRPMKFWAKGLLYISVISFYPWVVFNSFPLVYPIYVVALTCTWVVAAYAVILSNDLSLQAERRGEEWTWRPQ